MEIKISPVADCGRSSVISRVGQPGQKLWSRWAQLLQEMRQRDRLCRILPSDLQFSVTRFPPTS